MKTFVIVLIALIIIGGIVYYFAAGRGESGGKDKSEAAKPPEDKTASMSHLITLKTNFGEIRLETYEADAPKAVQNFIALAEKGFYDGLIFHRVIKGFMIQGGDPNCTPVPKNDQGVCGTGGPGYKFEDELNPAAASYKEGYKKGVVAMANAGPDTNGSQFFIMLEDTPLPHNYTIFGKVVAGQDVVDAIGRVPVGPGDRPLTPVIINSVVVKSNE